MKRVRSTSDIVTNSAPDKLDSNGSYAAAFSMDSQQVTKKPRKRKLTTGLTVTQSAAIDDAIDSVLSQAQAEHRSHSPSLDQQQLMDQYVCMYVCTATI